MTKEKEHVKFGQDVWVWTFTGWEKFDWDSPVFESGDDAWDAFCTHETVTTQNPDKANWPDDLRARLSFAD